MKHTRKPTKEISARVRELESIGGSRILMQGGESALPFTWYTDLLKHLRREHPTIDLDCFSPIEIEGLAEVCGMSTHEVLVHLKSRYARTSRRRCRNVG